MADKLPIDLIAATGNRDSVVHASDADISDLSRKHTEADIARTQSATLLFNNVIVYKVGDFVLQNNIVYRAILANGPGSFTLTDWTAIVGTPLEENIDVNRFNLDNSGAVIFDVLGPTALAAGTVPYIQFDPALTPDAMEINVPTGNELAITFNGIERYSFDVDIFDLKGNNLQAVNEIRDSSGAILIDFFTGATPVNYISLSNASTGFNPLIFVEGSDTDVDLELKGQGAGTVLFDTKVARAGLNLGDTAADPTTSVAGDLYFNSTSNTFRGFDGTNWNNFPVSQSLVTTTLAADQLTAGGVVDQLITNMSTTLTNNPGKHALITFNINSRAATNDRDGVFKVVDGATTTGYLMNFVNNDTGANIVIKYIAELLGQTVQLFYNGEEGQKAGTECNIFGATAPASTKQVLELA